MLQITSGRFWDKVDRYELQKTESLHSVVRVERSTTTSVGTLAPVSPTDTGIQLTEFTFECGLPLPQGGIKPGVMVGTSGTEIKEQMAALLTAYTNRFWTQEPDMIAELLERNQQSDALFPYLTVADEAVLEHDALLHFIEQAISLPRSRYQKVIAAATTIQRIIQASKVSYDAAFSMAIFAIESLVPEEGETPDWSYLPQKTRRKIDEALSPVEEFADQVRAALLEDRHFKLQTKFIKFIEDRIDRSFYRSPIGIRRIDLRRVLRNAYSGRSKYAHKLGSVEKPSFGIHIYQSVTWKKGEPYLTLQGAVLLLSEVIRGSIRLGPHLEKEEGVDWDGQLPGVVRGVSISPEYWLWSPKVLGGGNLQNVLCHVVEYIVGWVTGVRKPNIDLTEGLEVGISRIEQMAEKDRLCLICMVILWVRFAGEQHKPKGYDRFLEKNLHRIGKPSPESLMMHIVGDFNIPWSMEDSIAQWEQYIEKRYGNGKLRFIQPVESAMQGAIANMLLDTGQLEPYKKCCNLIADSEGNRKYVIQHLEECIASQTELSIATLLGVCSDLNASKT